MFEKKINDEYLKLAQIAYGGEGYLDLKNYKLKKVVFNNAKIEVVGGNYIIFTVLYESLIDSIYSNEKLCNDFVNTVFTNELDKLYFLRNCIVIIS